MGRLFSVVMDYCGIRLVARDRVVGCMCCEGVCVLLGRGMVAGFSLATGRCCVCGGVVRRVWRDWRVCMIYCWP